MLRWFEMYKLNNRGWSLGLMVTLLCVLFLFIIIITIISSNFKKNVIDPNLSEEFIINVQKDM